MAPVSGTVLPLEVFNMAAIRRSLLCFPMICSMIVFLYKIISIYLEIGIIGHQTLGIALNDSKDEKTRVPKLTSLKRIR